MWGVQGSTEPAPCQGQPQCPEPILWGLPRAAAGIIFSPFPNICLGCGSAARVLWARGEAGSPPNKGHGGVWGSWGAPGMGLLVPGWCQAPTHPRGWLVLQAGLSPAPCTVPNPAWGCSSTSHPPLAAFHTWPQRSPRGASREPGTARPRAASAVGAHVAPQGQPGTVGALPGAPPASPRAGPSWLGWGCHGLGQAVGQSLGAVPATSPGIWERGGSRSPSFVPGSVSPLDGAGRRAPSGAVGRDRRWARGCSSSLQAWKGSTGAAVGLGAVVDVRLRSPQAPGMEQGPAAGLANVVGTWSQTRPAKKRLLCEATSCRAAWSPAASAAWCDPAARGCGSRSTRGGRRLRGPTPA